MVGLDCRRACLTALLLVIHAVVTCEEHCLDCLGETKIVSHHVVLQNLFI